MCILCSVSSLCCSVLRPLPPPLVLEDPSRNSSEAESIRRGAAEAAEAAATAATAVGESRSDESTLKCQQNEAGEWVSLEFQN